MESITLINHQAKEVFLLFQYRMYMAVVAHLACGRSDLKAAQLSGGR